MGKDIEFVFEGLVDPFFVIVSAGVYEILFNCAFVVIFFGHCA
jgi:hypothetical protein